MTTNDPTWLEIASFVLGAFGAILGLYNLYVARHERRLKERQGFALTLLALEPLVDRMLAVPLSSMADLNPANQAGLVASLNEVERTIDADRKDLATLIPGLAGKLLDVRTSANRLRSQLSDPIANPDDISRVALRYLEAAWSLSHFRSFAYRFDIPIVDQRQPTPDNFTGDPKVKELGKRWETFFRLTVDTDEA